MLLSLYFGLCERSIAYQIVTGISRAVFMQYIVIAASMDPTIFINTPV